MPHHKAVFSQGFTLIELVITLIILAVLAVGATPRFLDLSRDARIVALESVAGQLEFTIQQAQIKARLSGLSPVATNPGGIQTGFVVDFGFGRSEVDFRNLCPESAAEAADRLQMLDFIDISDEFQTRVNNQYTLIGFEVPTAGIPLNAGCYLIYDSFGLPNCTVTVVTQDC